MIAIAAGTVAPKGTFVSKEVTKVPLVTHCPLWMVEVAAR